jgi:hypothetical protein
MSIVKNFQQAGSSSSGVESVAVSDTNSIDLTVSGSSDVTISADAKISPDSGNQLSVLSNGLFVPTPSFSQNVKVDFYDTPGEFTWTKPAGAIFHEILLIGGGGGGAAGFVRYSGNNGTGGGGGTGGSIVIFRGHSANFNSTESISIGAGGAGGVGQTVGLTRNPGSSGGNTTFSTIFGAITALGGAGGPISGQAAGQTNSCILYDTPFNSSNGGEVGGSSGSAPAQVQRIQPTGGGSGGGGIDSDFFPGGSGGGFITLGALGYPANGASGGVTIAENGQNGYTIGMIGIGAGGGAGNNTASSDGGKGGDGGLYGGGGGGGGCATAIWLGDETKKAGSGGNGGGGCIMIVSYIL